MKFAFVFPGQGSQAVGMLKGSPRGDLPEVREALARPRGARASSWPLDAKARPSS